MRFTFGSMCGNKAFSVHVGDVWIGVSYETPIACSYKGKGVRLDNTWGPTTGKHMRELGCKGYPVVNDQDFAEFMQQSLMDSALSQLKEKFDA